MSARYTVKNEGLLFYIKLFIAIILFSGLIISKGILDQNQIESTNYNITAVQYGLTRDDS